LGHEDVVGLVPSQEGKTGVEEGEGGGAKEEEESPEDERGEGGG